MTAHSKWVNKSLTYDLTFIKLFNLNAAACNRSLFDREREEIGYNLYGTYFVMAFVTIYNLYSNFLRWQRVRERESERGGGGGGGGGLGKEIQYEESSSKLWVSVVWVIFWVLLLVVVVLFSALLRCVCALSLLISTTAKFCCTADINLKWKDLNV